MRNDKGDFISADWMHYKPRESDRDRYFVRGGQRIHRYDIPSYFCEENMRLIGFWLKYRKYGLPYHGGWAEQPAVVMDVIDTLETEAEKKIG